MKRTDHKDIDSTVFPARAEAVLLLARLARGEHVDAAERQRCAAALAAAADAAGVAPAAIHYRAFAELFAIADLLVTWRNTVLDAGLEAQRYLTAARERAAQWRAAADLAVVPAGFVSFADAVASIAAIGDVPTLIAALAAVPLPIIVWGIPAKDDVEMAPAVAEPLAPELTVAFLSFTIDGVPLSATQHVTPGQTHDMDVTVRVSRWPSGATKLVISPLSIEPPGSYHLPTFELDAPFGTQGPFHLSQNGRATLNLPQHINARPFEFKYAARFEPSSAEQPVALVGQRSLILESIDFTHHPLSGYPDIDKKLVAIRNSLRTQPHVPQTDLAHALTVLAVLGNLAGQSVQSGRFATVDSEKQFQTQLTEILRGDPRIGADLEEHPHAAGGITDLSFHGIRIELKFEKYATLSLQDCARYLPQTASYAVGSGKSLAILCVLDVTPKTTPAFPAQDGIGVFPFQQNDGTPVYIPTVLLQSGLAKPSSL